jgi:hypothetical protein
MSSSSCISLLKLSSPVAYATGDLLCPEACRQPALVAEQDGTKKGGGPAAATPGFEV